MAKFCLTPKQLSSKRFKDLAKRYGVSTSSVETAIHIYGSKIPDAEFLGIDLDSPELQYALDDIFKYAELEFTNQQDYQEALDFWAQIGPREDGTVIFNTIEKAQRNYKKILGYLGKEAVSLYLTEEGRYIIRAAKPVYNSAKDETENSDIRLIKAEDFKNDSGVSFTEDNQKTSTLTAEGIFERLGTPNTSKRIQVVKNPNEYLSDQDNNEAVVAYRNSRRKYHFGNPFVSKDKKGELLHKENVLHFIEWLTTDKYVDIEPERRAWIIDRLKSGELKNKPIYYGNTEATKLGIPSHANALEYLINTYNWQERSEPVSRNERKTYSGKITSLKPNQVFVFGSNTLGTHGAGAAKTAAIKFGAKRGLAEGIQGLSFAIITKDLTNDDGKKPSRTLKQIQDLIRKLYEYANMHPEKEFLVAYSATGKNLNHYTSEQMALLFASIKNMAIPSNIVFEKGFNELVMQNVTTEIEATTLSATLLDVKSESAPQIQSSAITRALAVVDRLRELSKRIWIDPESHLYRVYSSEQAKLEDKTRTKGVPATSVSKTLHPEKRDFNKWGLPSQHLGNTADEVTRDFFAEKFGKGKMKTSYPNLSKKLLDSLKEDLEKLHKRFQRLFGKNYIAITEEFPIAARTSDGSYIAGTMDMIIIDENGDLNILDMKAKRSGISQADFIDYGNLTSLYQSIVEASITPQDGVKFDKRYIIQFEASYPAPLKKVGNNWVDTGMEYTILETGSKTGQIYLNGKKIQDSNETFAKTKYRGIFLKTDATGQLVLGSRAATLVDVSSQTYDIKTEPLDGWSQEDIESAEEDIMLPQGERPISAITFQQPSSDNSRESFYGNPILTPSERTFLAHQAMYAFSYVVTHLQSNVLANQTYFPEGTFSGTDFTKMSRQDIIEQVGIDRIFALVRLLWFNPENRVDIEDDLTLDKLEFVYNNFEALKQAGYAKLISLEGVTVEILSVQEILKEIGDESLAEENDSGRLEEKQREYWQLGFRQVSAKSSLSVLVRRMFERLKVIDENGLPIKDDLGFGFDTYVDPNTAVNNILEWVKSCDTIELMEAILKDKALSHPYLNTILEKIKEQPLRAQFFLNFRKDFTQYSIVTQELNDEGKIVFKTHIINTKGASKTILLNLVARFSMGKMLNLIVTRDNIEGKGQVNMDKVEEYEKTRKILVKTLSDSFGRKNYNKVLETQIPLISALLSELGLEIPTTVLELAFAEDPKKKAVSGTATMKILDKIGYILSTLEENSDRSDYGHMLREEENSLYSTYKGITDLLEPYMERYVEASSYENGKTYYSFTTPSYMGKMIRQLKDSLGDEKQFKKYIRDHYKKYRWFAEIDPDTKQTIWHNEWLDLLAGDAGAKYRQILDHKVQLNFNKTDYKELSELSYTLSLMSEYFSDKDKLTAWYRVPILSNKPSSEFVKFKRYSGARYKHQIRQGLYKVFTQEVLRIKTVMERASAEGITKIGVKEKITYDILDKVFEANPKLKSKLPKVVNSKVIPGTLTFSDIVKNGKLVFAGSGAEFKFLEALNLEFINKTKLGQLILDKINGKKVNEAELQNELLGVDNKRKHTDGAIDRYMKQIVDREISQWRTLGVFDIEKKITKDKEGNSVETNHYKYEKMLGQTEEEILDNLEEYVWNDMFATINIIELTAVDLAYYRNMEDFQKRYAQVHSPTLRFDTTAEWNGQRVSADGISRTIYLKDQLVKSLIIDNVKVIFDRKIASIKDPNERREMKIMRDMILKKFEEINIADAQGYSSPTSYRKKMVQAGRWDDNMEEAYNRIRLGNFNIRDLNVVWQPLKPFVYSCIGKTSGAVTMSEILVPVQNKNSEYLLLLADAIIRSGNQVSALTAIFDFMEESAYDEGHYNGIGIDTVQFESAVNSGSMGAIDISNISKMREELLNQATTTALKRKIKNLEDVEIIKNYLNFKIYYDASKREVADNDGSRYNDQYVHEIPFEDYGIQNEVSAYLTNYKQMMGSLIRILGISDISDGAKFRVRGYEYLNAKGGMDKQYLIDRYLSLIAANIEESFETLMKELNIYRKKYETEQSYRLRRNLAMSKLLKESIIKDQKYTPDLLRACSLDKNGEFIIPLSDPIQSSRILQLINSIIKSRINKQTIQGGPAVQASVFGMSDDLHIIFEDKDGNVLRTKEEKESDEEYAEYLKLNQGSLRGVEVYLPVPSEELERRLTLPNGSLMSVEQALEAGIVDSEMLKAIGYRIPTEDKYSMVPMIIKGFMPKGSGEAVMMPKEITLLTGSDFDIDKMYIMFKSFDTNKLSPARIASAVRKIIAKQLGNKYKELKEEVGEIIKKLVKGSKVGNSELEKMIKKAYKDVTGEKKNGPTKVEHMTSDQRNDEVFDILWAVLTSEDTMEKMFNPGSFDNLKKSAKIIQILKSGVRGYTYEKLKNMSLGQLDEIINISTKRNIIHSTTLVYFHKQNMTAGTLIGVFANNNTSHAFCSMHNIHWNIEGSFGIDGKTVSGDINNTLDRLKAFDGTLISKNIASYLAASVDAVKDPVLNFMNLNSVTAGPAMVLTRLGFDPDSVGMLMSQPIIEEVCREYSKLNNEGYVSIESVITDKLKTLLGALYAAKNYLKTSIHFSKEELALGLTGLQDHSSHVLMLFKRLCEMAKHQDTLTFLTKFNSVTNAPGPNISDSLTMRERYNKFTDIMESYSPPFSKGALNIINNTPILNAFFDTTVGDAGAAKQIFEYYFPHYTAMVTHLITKLRRSVNMPLDAKTIDTLINDFLFYKMTIAGAGQALFNMDSDTRAYFIKQFPADFAARAEGLVDNELIQIIGLEPRNRKCPVVTLSANTGGFSADIQEKIKNAWSALMQNEETFELGRDLFIYNLIRSGFTFSPKTFLHLASVDTKLAMSAYIDLIRDLEFNDLSVNEEDFLIQFKRNHPDNPRIVPKINFYGEALIEHASTKDRLVFKVDKDRTGLLEMLAKDDDTVVDIVNIEGELYYTNTTDIKGKDSVVYIKIPRLGITNNFLEYNAEENGLNMRSVLAKSEQSQNKNKKSIEESVDTFIDLGSTDSGKEELPLSRGNEDGQGPNILEPKEPTDADVKTIIKSFKKLFPEEVNDYNEMVGVFEETSISNPLIKKFWYDNLLIIILSAEQQGKDSVITLKLKELMSKFCKI